MNRSKLVSLLLAVLLIITGLTACNEKATPTGTTQSSITETSADSALSEDDEVISAIIVSSESEESQTTGSGSEESGSQISETQSSTAVSSQPKPTNVPVITPDPADLEAKLPELNITNKNVTVCIDWAPNSSWVVVWGKAFEACYPGIKVSYKIATPAVKASKLAVWKSSGTSPDAIYIKPEESWPNLVNLDLVESIDSMVDMKAPFWGTVKSTMEGLKVNNKLYAIVTDEMLYGSVIYKKSVLQNAGLKDPIELFYEDKWTWDVFVDYAKKLTKINVEDDSKSRYGAFFHYAEPFIGSTGRDLIGYTSQGWVSYLNHADTKAYINFLQQLGPTGQNYTLTTDSDMTSVRAKTLAGQIGMFVTAEAPGLEFPTEFQQGQLSFVPIPRFTSSKTYYHASTVNAFYIPKGAKNPLAGLAYAASIRAMHIMDLDLPSDGTPASYTEDQQYVLDYSTKVLTGVPMQFRRLSGTVEYYNIYGPTFLSGDSYSGIVAEWEPKIIEALRQEN